MRVSLVLVATIVLVLGSVTPCAASAPRPQISWTAPVSCGDDTRVEAEISRLLGATSGFRVDGQILATSQGFRLSLFVDTAEQRFERQLDSGDCSDLIEATLWLVKLAIHSSLSNPDAPTPSDTPREQPPQPVVSEPDAISGEAPAPSGEATSSVDWHVGLLTGGFAPGLSGLEWSVGARGGVRIDALRIELTLMHHFAHTQELEFPAASATFQSQELSADACLLFGRRFHAGPCLFLALVVTRGESAGITRRAADAHAWLTAGPSGSIGYSLSKRLVLRLDAGVWIPLTSRPHFEIEVLGEARRVAEANLVGGFGRLGIDIVL